MRNRRSRTPMLVEALEPRELMAAAIPVLTTHTVNVMDAEVKTVMSTLARTHNFGAASTSLTRIASQAPFGRQDLAPTWVADLGIYSPQVRGSGLVMEKQILNDLNLFVVNGVASGEFRITGPGSTAFQRPVGVGAPTVSAASVRIVNNTGLSITVVANLNGTMQTITRQIANGGTALFDFQSSSTNFISINIARTDGGQPPPPSIGNLLSQPISGYNGKSFPISVFAGRYSIRQA